MEYQPEPDAAGHQYIEVSFEDGSDALLRLTYINKDNANSSVRINKIIPGGAPFPGPEPELSKIPLIVEALMKIYNDHS